MGLHSSAAMSEQALCSAGWVSLKGVLGARDMGEKLENMLYMQVPQSPLSSAGRNPGTWPDVTQKPPPSKTEGVGGAGVIGQWGSQLIYTWPTHVRSPAFQMFPIEHDS